MSEVRFGAYRITETIGQGAVTTLYKAVHEPLGRVVAVKALKTQIAPTSSFGAQIEREAKILADLAHPNVVLALDHGRGPSGRPFLALELVDGPSLEALLAKKKRLSVAAALAIAIGIASALEHVHEREVVHRDVKPGNVLLAKSGLVKLIDFGIAHKTRLEVESDEHGELPVTPSGHVGAEALGDGFGTPAYMSPEQILGDFVDGRSDLFSLGVVLYQMLTGTRPWEPPAMDRSAKRSSRPALQRREPPAPLRERAPDLPRAVSQLVMRLLEPSPSARHANASVVRERLEAALRLETREAPANVVRAALVEAGFVAGRGRGSSAGVELADGGPWSLAKVTLGFAGVLVLFVGVTFLVARPSRAGLASARITAASPLPAEGGSGLRVIATPWAHVKVDGVMAETTPFARPIPLAPGRHWVQLTHPDAPPVEKEIEVGEGQIVMLDVTMPVGALDAGTPLLAPEPERKEDP